MFSKTFLITYHSSIYMSRNNFEKIGQRSRDEIISPLCSAFLKFLLVAFCNLRPILAAAGGLYGNLLCMLEGRWLS